MKVLHLMVNNVCTNNCPLCCNKQYDVNKIPAVTVEELSNVETLCITGGEPFLSPMLCRFLIVIAIYYPNLRDIIIYTSGAAIKEETLEKILSLKNLYNIQISLSIGPKSDKDRSNLEKNDIRKLISKLSHNRFYCFSKEDRELAEKDYNFFNTEIIDREWQETFKAAPNSIFRRLPIWI